MCMASSRREAQAPVFNKSSGGFHSWVKLGTMVSDVLIAPINGIQPQNFTYLTQSLDRY